MNKEKKLLIIVIGSVLLLAVVMLLLITHESFPKSESPFDFDYEVPGIEDEQNREENLNENDGYIQDDTENTEYLPLDN